MMKNTINNKENLNLKHLANSRKVEKKVMVKNNNKLIKKENNLEEKKKL
jgi:hypothetical protein